MDKKKIKINVFTYNAAIAALAKSSKMNSKASNSIDEDELWKRALYIVDEMKTIRSLIPQQLMFVEMVVNGKNHLS
jgi:hypothetical protein